VHGAIPTEQTAAQRSVGGNSDRNPAARAAGADRRPLSSEIASELRDALRRRQKELPARWLAAVDATTLREGTGALPVHARDAVERELGLALLQTQRPDARPRGIVCIRPSASSANVALADALCMRGSVASVAAVELDSRLAVEMLDRVASRGVRELSSALACDCTVELPLPDDFPRPRVYLCLGNVLGSSTAVGAVRLLRVLRTTMSPSDSIVLGLDAVAADPAPAVPDDDHDAAAARHLQALGLINATVGGGFDLSRFEYRTTFDTENIRVETHLVARRAIDVTLPGVCDVRFRKGESIRTSVSCRFDRNRVTAMMAGVGLALREWTEDSDRRFVVALSSPAV